jgi:hypothetical protein
MFRLFHKKVNQPYGTDEVVNINDITVPNCFKLSRPNDFKVMRIFEQYKELGYLDRPITVIAIVNTKGKRTKLVLVDEYIRYRVAIYAGLTKVPIKYSQKL